MKGRIIMKKRLFSTLLTIAVILCFCSVTYAITNGRYLSDGSCSISPGTGYVYVKGETNAYEPVSSITVELKLYKEVSPSVWVKVWEDSKTATNDDQVKYSKKKVTVDSGYNYKLSSTHSIKNGSYNESNDVETAGYYVD